MTDETKLIPNMKEALRIEKYKRLVELETEAKKRYINAHIDAVGWEHILDMLDDEERAEFHSLNEEMKTLTYEGDKK